MRFLLLLLFLPLFIQSQSILYNGSFEEVNICEEHSAKCSPSGWFFVRQVSAQGFFTTNKFQGTEGNNYLGIIIANDENNFRHYWQTRLLCPIKKGETYTVTLRLSSNEIGPNLNYIGLLLTNKFTYSELDTLIQAENALSLIDSKVKRLKYNWFEIKKTFVATQNASHIILGNFSTNSNKEILQQLQLSNKYIILVDAVELITSAPCLEENKISLELRNNIKRHLAIAASPKEESKSVKKDSPIVAEKKPVDKIVIQNILFDLNSYRLKNEVLLDIYKSRINKIKIGRIQVLGFTDDSGSAQYNQELSTKRAEEVARILSERFLIAPSKIQAEGRGISREFSDKEKNRRVEILIFEE